MNMIATAATAMPSPLRKPISERTKRSRPSWSVPARWAQVPPSRKTGGRKRSRTLIFMGSNGESSGQMIAAPTSTVKTPSPILKLVISQARRNIRRVTDSPRPRVAPPVWVSVAIRT